MVLGTGFKERVLSIASQPSPYSSSSNVLSRMPEKLSAY